MRDKLENTYDNSEKQTGYNDEKQVVFEDKQMEKKEKPVNYQDIEESDDYQDYDAGRDLKYDYRDNKEKKLARRLRNSRIVNVILALLLVVVASFLIYVINNEKNTKEAFFNKIYISKNTYYLTEDLKGIVERFNEEGYTASVETINGYEYLALSTQVGNKTVKICYQNEFPDEKMQDSTMKAFISSGSETVNLSGSYDISHPEANLPYKVAFTDGTMGLLFMETEGDMPADLNLYDINTMKRTGAINMTSTIRYYFSVEAYGTEGDMIKVVQNGIPYTFKVDNTLYAEAIEKEEDILKFKKDFIYSIGEDRITFTAYISLEDNSYIGQYDGIITFDTDGFDMSYQRFAAYVTPDYEDPGNDRILTAKEEYPEENIIIAGKNGGYYALEYYKNVPLSDYDYERVAENEQEIRYYTDVNGQTVSKAGVDVSYYQGKIDWGQVAEQEIEFVIPRIAYRGYSKGAIVKDECFDDNVKYAKEAGLDVGVYIFSQAVTVEEGIEEAEFILEEIRDMDINGPIVFDTEYYDEPADARANLITREERTAIAKAFCETIEEAGYKPMIYANTRWLLLGIDWDQLAEYDVWYAYYGEDPILPYDFAIWQYSSQGSVNGIEGPVDMNIMFKDVFE
ncbi:MAG: glycoside hydrolase family 25 protein [Lachnospiraceae bacterium]